MNSVLPEIKRLAAKHTRLVSFENSNSWIKRHDAEGTLLIQAGYRENPNSNSFTDDENPIVIISGARPRWYGEMACQGAHTKLHGRNKVETAREAFAATLRPTDDGRDLIVIASHWDKPLSKLSRPLWRVNTRSLATAKRSPVLSLK